jgi:hypothetical protein
MTVIHWEGYMRALNEIAQEIEWECSTKDWYVYAEAYVTPMKSLNSISDTYFADSAESIVMYALANLTSWRGENARRIKAELNGMLKGVKA